MEFHGIASRRTGKSDPPRRRGSTTVFHAGSLSDDFLAFGETPWNLSDQARFASDLRCIADHEPVVNAMAALSNGHDYGLGLIPGAIFKGGWSDNETGMYSVRQFGLIPTSDGGWAAVAISAESLDGAYESAQLQLNEVAQKLMVKVGELPRANC